MRLPFQNDSQPGAGRKAASRAGRASADPAAGAQSADDAVTAARTTARRRLIGASILLVVGVLGFPLLFETEPRPLPSNLPIVTAQNESARTPSPSSSPLPSPTAGARTPAAGPAESPPAAAAPARAAPAGPDAQASAAAAPAPAAASRAAPASTGAATPSATAAPLSNSHATVASKPQAAPAVKPPAAPVAAAAAVPPPKPAAASPRPAALPLTPDPPPGAGRYVVQVGAYSDAATLRDTRHKVEKLGLKTYTQVIESEGGRRTRVRVGPFGTRAEAQAAAAKLKAAGLPANLLTL